MKTLLKVAACLSFACAVNICVAGQKPNTPQSDKTLKSGQVKKDQSNKQTKKERHQTKPPSAISNKIAVSDQAQPADKSKGKHRRKGSAISNK